MINRFLDYWLDLPLWQRSALFIVCGCLLAAASWFLRGRPAWVEASRLADRRQQQAHLYRATLRQIRLGGPVSAIANDIAGLEASVRIKKAQAFLPLGLLEKAGGQLAFWQPDRRGGNLTLLLSWAQVKNVFLYLSERPVGLDLRHFSLKGEGERLRLQMTLVLTDEA